MGLEGLAVEFLEAHSNPVDGLLTELFLRESLFPGDFIGVPEMIDFAAFLSGTLSSSAPAGWRGRGFVPLSSIFFPILNFFESRPVPRIVENLFSS